MLKVKMSETVMNYTVGPVGTENVDLKSECDNFK